MSIGSDICEQKQDGHAAPFQELVALEELFSPLEYADDRTSPLEILHETAPAEQGSGTIIAECSHFYFCPIEMLSQ